MAKYVVGIDLGTSNSAVAYADLDEVSTSGRPLIRVLEVPQLVAPGDVQMRSLLPSALYEPAKIELPEEETRLPWDGASEDARPRNVVGSGARRLGSKTPIRLIESAKSWLCHGGVNRTSAILPWHAPDEVPKLSPVEASATYLAHLDAAWRFEIGKGDPALELSAQEVIITVPASFDEVARQLTLDAAKKAGLPNVHLIEEPLAAFYAFIARTGGTPGATGLAEGERVLIADVGGGTTDFTIVEVKAPDGETGVLGFERTAVGDHLLLGGDNMDLALAHAIEPKLTGGEKKLDAEGWAQLKLECRLAKEAMFTDPSRAEIAIVIHGRGTRLIADQLRTTLDRETLARVILDGYFPPLPPGEKAKPRFQASAGFAEYGLPFSKEPAITRHLAAFLMRHGMRVDALLFNGGALKPAVVRDRLSSVIGGWLRASGQKGAKDPRALIYDQSDDALELAVARGAAYFGLVRAGKGIRVGGGSPREYFLALDAENPLPEGRIFALCVAPRGMQDGQQLEVSSREFQLVTNRPVAFPIYTSTAPEGHPVGALLELDEAELAKLPPLQTVVKFGKQKAGTTVPVRIQARRTDIGTLELSCFSRMSGARFLLEFDLRATDAPATEEVAPAEQPFGGAGTKPPPEAGEVPEERLAAAKACISETFALETPRPDPDGIMKRLESALELPRDEWPLAALRELAEHLIELTDRRSLSDALEARWLNLVGFCLRPGDGFPMDDWRVRQLWRVHGPGLVHAGRDQCELNWWILWRRVASGLSRGHQEELSSVMFPLLIPALHKRAKKKPPRTKTQEATEIWRAAAALERIGAKSRAQLGDALVELLEQRQAPKSALWCLGRIGARRLLYGPREATVKASTAAGWIERLLKLDRIVKDEEPKDGLIAMARLVGDRQFDLEEPARKALASYLAARGAKDEELKPLFEVVQLDAAGADRAFGEHLPTGLKLG